MRLLLVGDSIRLGYQPAVREMLRDIADVVGTSHNCGSTRNLLEHIGVWVSELLEPGSIVHLNAGLHDLRRRDGPEGAPEVSLEEYGANLEDLVRRITDDVRCRRMILATSTPVDDERHAIARVSNRFDDDVSVYNRTLTHVARGRNLEVNDLNATIAADIARYLDTDGVHLTTAGNEAAARSVADVVRHVSF